MSPESGSERRFSQQPTPCRRREVGCEDPQSEERLLHFQVARLAVLNLLFRVPLLLSTAEASKMLLGRQQSFLYVATLFYLRIIALSASYYFSSL